MKVRDSGMPEEGYWNSFFDADDVIHALFPSGRCTGNAVEFGCGYGTFSLPAARHTEGTLYSFDVEPELIRALQHKAREQEIPNLCARVRDFLDQGTGLQNNSQSHAMIYNLLHLAEPEKLLREAFRVLMPGGTLSIIHWRSDIPTPRGPALDIRPTPEQCSQWMRDTGFQDLRKVNLSAHCPYHFGITASKS